MAAVTVSRCDDRLIAMKEVSAERSDEVDREAELLKRLAHPGLARFVAIVEASGGGRCLHTEFVSSDTWATRPLTDPAERVAGVAALAAVVADLHDAGVAHRRLIPAHVLHGDNDRPVLCSLTRAADATPDNRLIDLAALADLCAEPASQRSPLAGKLSPLADAARTGQISARELARKLDLLVAKRTTPVEPVRAPGGGSAPTIKNRPKRRLIIAAAAVAAAAVAGVAAVGWSRGSQTTAVAATVTTPEPEGAAAPLPPSASGNLSPTTDLVQSLPHTATAEVIDATGAGRAGTIDATGAGRAGTIDATGAGRAGTIDATGAGRAGTIDATGAGRAGTIDATGAGRAGTIDATGAGRAGTIDATGAGLVAGPGTRPSLSTLDGEPQDATSSLQHEEAPEQQPAAILEHRGRRYAVGTAGDIVAVGDWNCDGLATPAIVRPSTGDVVLFDAWPGPDGTISMPVRWRVDSPTDAEAARDGSCDLLRVYTATGSRLLDPKEEP